MDNPATKEELAVELEKHRGETVIWYEWGGIYNSKTQLGWLNPITDKFGIQFLLDSPVQYAKVRAAALTGNIPWHIGNGSGQASWSLGLDGALEELDFSIIDIRDYDEVVTAPWFFPGYAWTNAVAYSTETYPDGLPDMAAFFDFERFPGRRMIASPGWSWKTTLRFALLSENPDLLNTAEGKASLAQMSDEQIARAFEIMEEFGPNISAWWTGGADAPSLILSGEIDMSTSWASGVGNAIAAGEPIEICWNCGHLLATEPYWIPKGLKEQDPRAYELANLVLAWINVPENFVNIMEHIAWGPVNPKAIALMDDPRFDALRPYVPTAPANVQYGIWGDQRWDGENTDIIGELWLEYTTNY